VLTFALDRSLLSSFAIHCRPHHSCQPRQCRYPIVVRIFYRSFSRHSRHQTVSFYRWRTVAVWIRLQLSWECVASQV